MGDGRDIFTYVFEGLRAFQANAIPVVPLDASALMATSVAAIVSADGLGAAIAVRLEDLMKPNARTRVEALATSLGLSLDEVDLVIDLGAPNFEPYGAFAGALIAAMQKLGNLHALRNFVIVGTAIAETFKDVAKGAGQLSRHDWLFLSGAYWKVACQHAAAELRRLHNRSSQFQSLGYADDQGCKKVSLHNSE